jgi:hypothetical protein
MLPLKKPDFKVNVNERDPIITYLRKTDANYVTNSCDLVLPNESIVTVKGFLGVYDPTDDILKGGFVWGKSIYLNCIHFELNRVHRGVKINEYYSISDSCLLADKKRVKFLIKQFLNENKAKVHERMIKRDLYPNQRGGSGPHPRFEGRRRGSNGPNIYYNLAVTNVEMTQDFVDFAKALTIHYR